MTNIKFEEKLRFFKKIKMTKRVNLDVDKPIVVFLDGKNVTKNKFKYDLSEKNGFSYQLIKIAEKMCENKECTLYAGMDELSIIFHNSDDFLKQFDDADLLYNASIYLQYFLLFFWDIYPTTLLGISVFNIDENLLDEYINFRKECTNNASFCWFYKKYLPKESYKGKSEEEIIDLLKNEQLYDTYKNNNEFINGIEIKTHHTNEVDILENFLNL